MFIPMGTVVAVCMLVTLVFANRFPGMSLNRVTPPILLRIIGVVTGAAGLWNVLWYALRHLTELWGLMALGSGILMTLLSALLILAPEKQPPILNTLRPFAVVALAGFTFVYALTLYRL
ncbi:hypothetical protein [Granulosicoccus antarcticus]|uniref:Uncharacterized protein n=1 Tax=Granulosicoccus antarcticus IMCC3135 TaxID=1192854 RepID=A0A2Z2P0K7_9GAMM|nr:hypothetical protein [Granulosicoccus antarcticus]ASJ75841.1 hypothetical protein IMCC3135_28950 [Granulosicoccus antarcticus IMCC3135]